MKRCNQYELTNIEEQRIKLQLHVLIESVETILLLSEWITFSSKTMTELCQIRDVSVKLTEIRPTAFIEQFNLYKG